MSGCILSVQFFSGHLSRGRRQRKRSCFIHIPGCICRLALGFCKNIKKRTETLYQSFSPFMVERRGFEPLTSTMRTLRATNCANAPNFLGKFCANSPLTAWPTFTVLGIKYGRLILPTVLMPHISFGLFPQRSISIAQTRLRCNRFERIFCVNFLGQQSGGRFNACGGVPWEHAWKNFCNDSGMANGSERLKKGRKPYAAC